MTDVLVSLCESYGRHGVVEGLFICTQEEYDSLLGKNVYFGDILGKHSSVSVDLSADNLRIKSTDQDFIGKLRDLLGENVSGINPLEYLDED